MTDEDATREGLSDEQASADETPADVGGEKPGEVPFPSSPEEVSLTAQLKDLRPDEPAAPDAPLWSFDRAPSEEAAAGETPEEGEPAPEQPAAPPPGEPQQLEPAPEEPAEEPQEPEPAPEEPQEPEPAPQEPEPAPEEPEVPAEPAPEEPQVPAEPAAESPAERGESMDESAAAAAAAAAATVPAAAPPSPPPAVPREIDMGPERPNRWWAWVIVALAVVAAAGSVGYAWWWTHNRTVVVPDIVGKQPAEAARTLYEVSLALGTVSETPTSAAPAGTVVSQTPAAKTQVKPGDQVAFSVAIEPNQTRVPDLSGQNSSEAQKTLAKARLATLVVSSYNATAGVGAVVGQLPQSGTEMPFGSTVAIVVSKGPSPGSISVPKVTGLTEGEAVKLIQASNLKPAVYRSINPSVTSGQVMKQTPASHSSVPYQSTVQILVSQGSGAAPVTVPDVVGLSQSRAARRMKSAGLKASTNLVPSATVNKNIVISQLPLSGAKVARGTTVGLLVSAGNAPNVAVPSVVGSDTPSAKRALQSAGFAPVVFETEVAAFTPGVVFAQFPLAGVQYPRYLPVVAVVAKTPTP